MSNFENKLSAAIKLLEPFIQVRNELSVEAQRLLGCAERCVARLEVEIERDAPEILMENECRMFSDRFIALLQETGGRLIPGEGEPIEGINEPDTSIWN